MAFEDADAFLAGPLRLPIQGKIYEIPQLSAKVGLELATEAIKAPLDADADDLTAWRALLSGKVFDRMLADGLPGQAISRAGLTVWTDYLLGREAAEHFWKLGSIPEALAALAAASGKATPRKTRTGAANTATAHGTGSSTRLNGRTSTAKPATRSRGNASTRSGRS